MSDPMQLFKEAFALQEQGRLDAAVVKYDELLVGYHGNAQTHTNRGLALFELGRIDEAITAYLAAISADDHYASAHYSLGLALFARRRFTESLARFDRAVQLAPSADAYVSRGSARMELFQYEAALEDYDAALDMNPHYPKVHMNKGSALYEMERLGEAKACFEQALTLYPGDHSTEWNLALCLLRAGNFKQGWFYYERRLEGSRSQPLRRAQYGKPRCTDFANAGDASALQGKTVLLWPEQGHGDVMQFCRYALELERLGVNVIFEVYPSMLRLLQAAFANTSIRVALDGATSATEFDFHTPLLSLPLICGTDCLKKIPADVPYLFAKLHGIALPSIKLCALRVGLVWAGGSRQDQPIDAKVDAARSLRFEQFVPLLELTKTNDVQFFSLQLGEPALQADSTIVDLTANLNDWADTAALIANLDLVISVDTAVAHLAAAMGKPTWILSRFNGCWRWLQDRNDSPWYPTVRLFRQSTRGDWPSVIEQVALALKSLLERPANPYN